MDDPNLPAAFTTMRWTNKYGYLLADLHVARLEANAQELGYATDQLASCLENTRAKLEKSHATAVVRIDIESDGTSTATVRQVPLTPHELTVAIDTQPVSSSDKWLQIKSTNRQRYEQAKSSAEPNLFDVVLWNESEQITEGTFNNIVLKLDGKYVTPKLEAGLLAGTLRQQLVNVGSVSEATVTKPDLEKAQEIYMINSVRGWIKVGLRC